MQKQKVITSLLYKFSERLAVKGLGLIISIVLARLLAPEQFGQIAIIMVFINLSQTLVQSGLNTALVQNKKTKEADYSTVFFISLAISVLLIAVLFAAAPFIGAYYKNNALILPLRVYSFSLIFAAFNSVQVAKLQREMKFRETMLCSLAATVFSGVVGIAAAFCGAGTWALIAYYFSNTACSCISMLLVARWRPTLVFSVQRAKELFAYGWRMLVSGVLCSLYSDIRSLIIGKMFSEESLGYYNRGQQFPEVIANTLDTSVQSVMFPVLADAQDNISKVKEILKRTVSLGSFVIIPVMVGLAATAEPVIKLLLTDKWLPSVIFVQIICIGNAALPITSANLIAIKAIGRSDVYMKLEVVRRSAMLAVLAVSVFGFRGVEAIAWGFAISAWLDVAIISVASSKLLNYGLLEQLRDIWKVIAVSAVMWLSVTFAGAVLEMVLPSGSALALIGVLAVQVIVGAVLYILLCALLKVESLKYALNTAARFFGRRSK